MLDTPPLLLHHPTASREWIVFEHAADLWRVPAKGGDAVRLTSGVGSERSPHFSPDGRTIAFTGELDGNVDVYVVPVEGSVPKRLTAHPGTDDCRGWRPDGKAVLFTSNMLSNTDHGRLFTVPTTGGFPTALPFPAGVDGAFSPDATRVAVTPHGKWQDAWKRYRGGQVAPIRIIDLKDSRWKDVPRDGTDDTEPVWVGDRIYYRSDPNGVMGVHSYDLRTGKKKTIVPGVGPYDVKTVVAGPGGIAVGKVGSVLVIDPATDAVRTVPISLTGDFPEVRKRWVRLADRLRDVRIAPTGKRVLVVGRGYVGTVPVEKGDARVFAGAEGVDRHDARWSPDGKTIAYVSDEGGRERLILRNAADGTERTLELGDGLGNYRGLEWSPDSTAIAYGDEKLAIRVLDVVTGKRTKVDEGTYRRGGFDPRARWSPDGKWLVYARDLPNLYSAAFLWSRDTGKTTQLTDGLASVSAVEFDRAGRHILLLASTDVGLGQESQDISSIAKATVTSSLYAIVLRNDDPSPLVPESDEEPDGRPATAEKKEPFRIDLDGIGRRMVALPMPAGSYSGLARGPEGAMYVQESGARTDGLAMPFASRIWRYDFAKRSAAPFATADGIDVSADGKKAMLLRGRSVSVVDTSAPVAGPGDPVDLSGLTVRIDPVAEWSRMFDLAIRQQKIQFYDPGLHGVDLDKVAAAYRPFLDGLHSREDLNVLFNELFGELSVGHMFIGGGDSPGGPPGVPGGLLGADYEFVDGRYRLARVYDGEEFNPFLRAPLSAPGVSAKKGEFLLAIDGRDLTDANDVYEALENKAGKQVKVRLGPTADGKGSREVVVVPVANEFGLRQRAWAEDNRRRVAEATGGKAGYVHVPDTYSGGWREFARYYYAQADKAGLVVDERFNHGGAITDFLVREMTKPLILGSRTRHGKDFRIPTSAVYGPKVMIANEMAGSGGDIFPWVFRKEGVGKIVGTRTWGAMISSYGFELPDGGSVRAPDDAIYDADSGEWVIEGEGTAPDIEVPNDPYLWRQGRDAQLEKAIEVLKAEMAKVKPVLPLRPPYPDKSKLPVVYPKPTRRAGG